MERTITITPEGLRDVIDGNVQAMDGDAIVAERVARVLARDCARRKLCAILLPALETAAVSELVVAIDSWPPSIRRAAWEVLNASRGEARPGGRVRSGDAEGGSGGAGGRAAREGQAEQ